VSFAHRIPGIQDYGAVGDCRSMALISCRGSVDWLCWPRFDSDATFAALIDRYRGGHWSITPRGPFRSEQHYRPGSNVLQTLFSTASGRATLTDLMPVYSEEFKRDHLVPDHELLRELRCTDGAMEFEIDFRPRPGFAQHRVRLESEGALGLRVLGAKGMYWLRGEPALAPGPGDASAVIRVEQGDLLCWSLTYSEEAPAALPLLGEESHSRIERTIRWWRDWSAQCRYHGPYAKEVERSALTLKMLSYAPSGAIAAAATTSLPERLHDQLNWDYRFCWLRDASLTVRAMLGLGYLDEVESFVSWLLYATRLTQPRLRVLYDLFGRLAPGERILPHFEGYRGSRPVRVGNDARSQFQLDTYGEVVEATTLYAEHVGHLDLTAQRALIGLGKYVAAHWDQPDKGIWESRGPAKNHTHSRLMCWTALDRLLKLEQKDLLRNVPHDRFAQERDRIRHQIETRAWNARLDSYVRILDGDQLDADLLHIGWYGFEPADSPRMKSTGARILENLGAGQGLLYRHKRNPPEGAFGACGFWAVEHLARRGDALEEAHALFRELLRYRSPVGLLSEEIDPETGTALGNIPQAFTHVGLISAALTLQEEEEARSGADSRSEENAA
jgi:GH15 family glucan-1,4-alpha-glucosidase